jgi:hypothetical protein
VLRHDPERPIRIYCRLCQQKKIPGKLYTWTRLYFPIPARFKEVVAKFLDRDLEVDMKVGDGDVLVIKARRQVDASAKQDPHNQKSSDTTN